MSGGKPPSRSNSNRSDPSRDTLTMNYTGGEVKINVTPKEIISVIDSLKKDVEAQRLIYTQRVMEENKQKLLKVTLGKEKRNGVITDTDNNGGLLITRQTAAINLQKSLNLPNKEKEKENDDSSGSEEEEEEEAGVVQGSNNNNNNNNNSSNKKGVQPVKLPELKRLPPYTTWIFLDRNQRMSEDQSVVGRRRIYYDQSGGEALICSDSEEEVIDEEEDKKEFVQSEDYILRMTVKQVGLSEVVLDLLGQCFSKKPSDVKARYEVLCQEEKAKTGLSGGGFVETSENANPYLDKDLEGALDSFDNLFCRRCYVFDCRLHGCSQDLIFPTEKQHPCSTPEEANLLCGPDCYRLAKKVEAGCNVSEGKSRRLSDDQSLPRRKPIGKFNKAKGKFSQSESASSNAKNASESSDSDVGLGQDDNSVDLGGVKPIGKPGTRRNTSKRAAERALAATQKKLKKMMSSDVDSVTSGDMNLRSKLRKEDEHACTLQKRVNSSADERSKKSGSSKVVDFAVLDDSTSEALNDKSIGNLDNILRKVELVDESPGKQEVNSGKSWKTLEKVLYEKGLEIYGKNSCLIARNLMSGLKTCLEVYQYITGLDNKLSGQGCDNGSDDGENMGNEVKRRSRYVRRKGRVRRLKYSWKSTGYHSIRKRISERKDQPCRQYNPCGCQSACGKQCPCHLNGTCCEKYCGCPKSCKNRFRGCHCAKSQCRSRQCPCFAADRECDPDVCRNCWVSCGDGTLGTPNQRGDNYECRNMKLLLKQQQRVLLGKSDVSGWGAFLKNSVGKHEYLGEYTGELISHREADKRGKIYDRENSSFLFNLNDQFVLDAYRKGDKLKFANHSPDPNCYAKVIMVAGDHRVGIFAKERINGGEELFYDYRYDPDRAPAWAKKPEAAGSKRDDVGPSSGRAKKIA